MSDHAGRHEGPYGLKYAGLEAHNEAMMLPAPRGRHERLVFISPYVQPGTIYFLNPNDIRWVPARPVTWGSGRLSSQSGGAGSEG